MLQYQTIPVTAFAQNCSIVWCDQTMEAAVIDPGGDLPRLLAAARRLGVTLKQILLTHAHIDHAGGTGTLARELACRSSARTPATSSGSTGCASRRRCSAFRRPSPSRPRAGWTTATRCAVGRSTLAVRHCPGHTPGHVVFHSAEAQRAFVGDVLFAGSIGRTDFPGGDHDTLIASITGSCGRWATTRCSSPAMAPRAASAASGAPTRTWAAPERARRA